MDVKIITTCCYYKAFPVVIISVKNGIASGWKVVSKSEEANKHVDHLLVHHLLSFAHCTHICCSCTTLRGAFSQDTYRHTAQLSVLGIYKSRAVG